MTRSESSRINGAKSRGPKTPEGKAVSSRNALSHGLTAKTMVLSSESSAEFDELLAGHLAHYAPVGPTETALVRELAAIQWRQTRLWGYETGLLQKQIDKDRDEVQMKWGDDVPEHERGALAFDGLVVLNESLPVLIRYDASLRRGFHKALEMLLVLQKTRRGDSEKLRNEPEPDRRNRAAAHLPVSQGNPQLHPGRSPARDPACQDRDQTVHCFDSRESPSPTQLIHDDEPPLNSEIAPGESAARSAGERQPARTRVEYAGLSTQTVQPGGQTSDQSVAVRVLGHVSRNLQAVRGKPQIFFDQNRGYENGIHDRVLPQLKCIPSRSRIISFFHRLSMGLDSGNWFAAYFHR